MWSVECGHILCGKIFHVTRFFCCLLFLFEVIFERKIKKIFVETGNLQITKLETRNTDYFASGFRPSSSTWYPLGLVICQWKAEFTPFFPFSCFAFLLFPTKIFICLVQKPVQAKTWQNREKDVLWKLFPILWKYVFFTKKCVQTFCVNV